MSPVFFAEATALYASSDGKGLCRIATALDRFKPVLEIALENPDMSHDVRLLGPDTGDTMCT